MVACISICVCHCYDAVWYGWWGLWFTLKMIEKPKPSSHHHCPFQFMTLFLSKRKEPPDIILMNMLNKLNFLRVSFDFILLTSTWWLFNHQSSLVYARLRCKSHLAITFSNKISLFASLLFFILCFFKWIHKVVMTFLRRWRVVY